MGSSERSDGACTAATEVLQFPCHIGKCQQDQWIAKSLRWRIVGRIENLTEWSTIEANLRNL